MDKPELTHKETSKTLLRNILQNKWPVLSKNVKVIEDKDLGTVQIRRLMDFTAKYNIRS